MTVHQHAVDVGTFAHYLREMTARLDPGRGWYGVFTRRDPQGMRSCLDGVEIPPWDVVESLLADLAEVHGAYFAEQVSVRAAALYSASAAAHDRRPGGRQELVHRLELMIREQGRAAERLRTAGAGGADPADPGALAWAHDDHRRASARCAELRKRLAAVTVPHPRAGAGPERVPGPAPEREVAPEPVPNPVPESAPAPGGGEAPGRSRSRRPAAGPAPEPAPRRRKPRGARFAGLDVDDEEETAYAPSPVPALPAPPSEGGSAPRGARFGGGPAEAAEAPAPAALPDSGAGEAVAAAVGRLVRLRAEGRSGEAHVVLCEVAAWPAPRLPVLAVALYRAGLAADWTTLLWEASSLPPAGFAAAAGALAAAGRDEDCGLLLRQGVARPAAEVAEAVLALEGAGREGEARALLGAFVRVRTPQEAAGLAGGGGDRVLPHLLAAAREVSVEREWDLIHALRVAGVPGV
ncbi:hypothetical protein [Streptomyces cyaneofuscatus]|uniref:hypothetical protein n=1 Tax=Streptomyces cyaneofuscatus TaxID=66883 RepID=UPI0033A26344